MAVLRRATAASGGITTGQDVRIAVIATGPDASEDRDLVDRFCLPEVRRHCRGRNIGFSESQLVTGSETARELTANHVAAVLDVLRRDRPIVVALLGRVRGVAVPARVLRSRGLLSRHPWLEHLADEGLSLAEIAVLEGVLGNPLMAGRVVASIRQPAAERRESRRPVDPLVRLAERVRSAGVTVVAGSDDRRALADRLCAELVSLVDQLLPDAPPPSPLEHVRRAQESFAASRRQAYVEVSGYSERLDEHVDADGAPLLITGETGAGKSALLANWTDRYRSRQPDAFIIAQYAGATGSDSDHLAMLRQIMVEIREHYSLKDEVPSTPEEIVEGVPIWLAKVRRERLILVLDGLDQLSRMSEDLEWLPRHIPPQVRLIASASDGPVATRLRMRGWSQLRLKPLTLSERRTMTKEFLGERSRMLTGEQLRRVTSESTNANPLFLRIRLEELRAHGPAGRLNERIDSLLGAGDLDKLFERVLERLERTHGEALVRSLMTMLWASRRGLNANDLELLISADSEDLANLLGALDFHLIARDGVLTFFHEGMRHAVTSHYGLDDGVAARAAHRTLAKYFGAMPMSRRRATEEPWQLQRAGNRRKLRDSIASVDMFMELSREDTEYELLEFWTGLGSLEDMADAYEASLATYELSPGRPTPLALVLDRLGRFFFHAGLYDRGDALLRRAVEISQSELGPSDPRAMEIAKHHVQALLEMGSYDESVERCQSMIAQLAPAHGDTHPMMIDALTMLADALHYQARYGEAEEMARRAVSACERVHGPEHPALAEALFNLAAILRDRGEQSIAESLLFRVLAIDEKVHGGSHPKTATTLSDLGYLYTKNRRFAEAESHLRRALEIREHILGTEHAHTAQSYHQLGVMFNTLERYDEAEPHFRNALRIFRRTFGSSHPNVAACLGNLGESLRHLDKLDEARSVTREALAIVETGIGVGHPMWFALVVKTGEIALHLENYDEAETHLLSASDWASKRKAETNRERLAVMMSLAELYRRRGELDRALSILGDVLECSDATGDPSKLERQVPLVRTAAIERERGDLRKARRLADEALTLIRGREPINRELEAEALEVIASKTSGNGDAARRAASLEHS